MHSANQPNETAHLLDRHPGFRCFKTAAPIHYPSRWMRDALIQAVLDPDIETMSPSSTPIHALPTPILFAFRTIRRGRRSLVLLAERAIDELDDLTADRQLNVVTRTQLAREPVCSTCRAVWAQSRLNVDAGDRYRAVERICEKPDGVPMAELVGLMRSTRLDPVDQILSFVATGHLSIDVEDGIYPGMIISPGPQLLSATGLFGQTPDCLPLSAKMLESASDPGRHGEDLGVRTGGAAAAVWGTERRAFGRLVGIATVLKPSR